MESNNYINTTLNSFNNRILDTISVINTKWNKRETIDVFELALDVLYFRNTDIFNSINILLKNKQINGAELLLRPLYEGVIIFEWCLIAPESRVLRFRRTSLEGMIELLENGYLKSDKYNINTYKEAIERLIAEGFKNIPNVKQMLNEIKVFNPAVSYNFYRFLSKITHGVFENFGDFLNFKENLIVQEDNSLFNSRFYTCVSTTLFLQFRNMMNFTKFDKYMFVDELNLLEEYYTLNVYPLLHQLNL